MRVVVIHNPVAGAGRAEEASRTLTAALTDAGHEVTSCPSRLDPVETWLEPALEGAGVAVVAGGDGAMRMVAPSAARCRTPIYHYPVGTENLFAREFSAWRSVPGLLDAIERHHVEWIDIGSANGRIFLLMVSVGFDAEVVADLTKRRTGGISRMSYVGPIVRQLRAWRGPRVTVRVDDDPVVEDQAGMVIVANCRQYGMRLDPALNADTTDGLLDLVFFPAKNGLDILRWGMRFRWRRQGRRNDLITARGRRVVIERPPGGARFQLDGDPPREVEGQSDLLEGPIDIGLRAAALPVLVGSGNHGR